MSCQQPQPGEDARSEHTYGGPGPPLLYSPAVLAKFVTTDVNVTLCGSANTPAHLMRWSGQAAARFPPRPICVQANRAATSGALRPSRSAPNVLIYPGASSLAGSPNHWLVIDRAAMQPHSGL